MKVRVEGKQCRNCHSANIAQLLNDIYYECQDCGYRWFVEGYNPTEVDIVELKRYERENRDKRRFRNQIRRQDVLWMVSPSIRFYNSFDCLAGTPQYEYYNELHDLLLQGVSYSELKKLPIPNGCSEKDFNNIIRGFLSSLDELPFAPTIEDWCKKLHASKEELSGNYSLKDNHIDLSIYLESELMVYDVFNIVFSGKVQEVKNRLSEEFLSCQEEEESINNCFSSYVIGGLPKVFMEKFFSNEKRVIDRFLEATRTKRQEFFEDAIKRNLSIIDTMMLFVDYAFEGYPEYQKKCVS